MPRDDIGDGSRDRVLLLHGLASGPWSLRALERALRVAGYETVNLAYPSRRFRIGQLATLVLSRHGALFEPDHGQLHVVTYSMGGLLLRAILGMHRPRRLGRVVMIAPPHHGSQVADLLLRFRLCRWVFGPVLAELGTRQPDSLGALLGDVDDELGDDELGDHELGIIAGDRAIDPLAWLLLPKPNDGRVSVASTRLSGMTAHVTVHATHFAMMRHRRVMEETLLFLRRGHFSTSAAPDTVGAVR